MRYEHGILYSYHTSLLVHDVHDVCSSQEQNPKQHNTENDGTKQHNNGGGRKRESTTNASGPALTTQQKRRECESSQRPRNTRIVLLIVPPKLDVLVCVPYAALRRAALAALQQTEARALQVRQRTNTTFTLLNQQSQYSP